MSSLFCVKAHLLGTLQVEINTNQIQSNTGFWGEGKTGVPRGKALRAENQQTQPTHDAESGNRTQATLVVGECICIYFAKPNSIHANDHTRTIRLDLKFAPTLFPQNCEHRRVARRYLFKDPEYWPGQGSNPQPPARLSDTQPTELIGRLSPQRHHCLPLNQQHYSFDFHVLKHL